MRQLVALPCGIREADTKGVVLQKIKTYLTAYTSDPAMCFIRAAIVGVDTRYVSTGPDDGMNPRAACLPPFWYALSQKHKIEAAKNSPVLQQLAHCLFYSFML